MVNSGYEIQKSNIVKIQINSGSVFLSKFISSNVVKS